MSFTEIVALLAMIGIDQFSKYLVVSKIDLYAHIEIIRDFFYLTQTHNTGVAWSMFSNATVVITVVALAASIGLIVFYITNKQLEQYEKFALLMIISGAVGNVIDRIFRGFVVDFLDFYIFGYDYPVFNIADSFIVIGAVIMIAANLLISRKDNNGRN